MATYLVAFGDKSIINTLSVSLSESESFVSEEQSVSEASPTSSVLVMAKRSDSIENSHVKNQFFSGWMLDHESSTIYLGQNGFEKGDEIHLKTSLEINEGAFVHAEWDDKSFTIRHDCFGVYPVLYFHTKKIFVASDSLLTLARVRKILSLENKLNKKVHGTRSWTHGLASSIMSTNTIVKGIRYLPPASSVTAHHLDPSTIYSLSVDKNIPQFPTLFPDNNENYVSVLHECVKQIVGTVSAIVSIPEIEIKFGLSGGLDSRVLLAFLKYNQMGLANVNIVSNRHPSRSRDLEIVKGLSEKFDFDFNKPGHSGEIIKHPAAKSLWIKNRFGNWALSNLGFFDMTYMHTLYWNHPAVIEMGGHGAEIVKGTFSETNLFAIAYLNHKQPTQYLKIRSEIKDGLKSIGIPFHYENKMQWHYLCYKSAIQSGSSIGRTLFSLRPLMNRKLCSLGLHLSSKETNTILEDILITLDPELASFPFDSEQKNIAPDYIRKQLQLSSKSNMPAMIEPYKIFGSIIDIKNGNLESFSSFGDDFPVESEDLKENISSKMDEVWNNISNKKLKKQYNYPYRLAKSNLEDSDSYVPSAGSPAAKIISLGLIDNLD